MSTFARYNIKPGPATTNRARLGESLCQKIFMRILNYRMANAENEEVKTDEREKGRWNFSRDFVSHVHLCINAIVTHIKYH